MGKHTSGPWQKIGSKVKSIGMNERLIAAASVQDDEGQANASLICAAPDLLEALIDARNKMVSQLMLLRCDDQFIQKETMVADKAIARARGQS